MKVICMPIVCNLFRFFSRGIRMHITNLTGVQNGRVSSLKETVFLLKKFCFEASFLSWKSLYANCLFYILTIYPKCHLFQFFSCNIRMYIPVLTGVQNGRTRYFRYEDQLYPKFMFDSLIIYFKWSLFQFFSRGICRHIPILTRVQIERKSHQKDCFFAKKQCFCVLISMMNVTGMPNACSIFWLFILDAIVFISLVEAYVCILPS